MPAAETILDGLTNIANAWQGLAVAWHVLFAALALAAVAGFRLLGTKVWSIALAAAGFIYGAIGVFGLASGLTSAFCLAPWRSLRW
jgi:hypothetical protein